MASDSEPQPITGNANPHIPTKETVDDIFYPPPTYSEHILWSPPYKIEPIHSTTTISEPKPLLTSSSIKMESESFSYTFHDDMIAEIQAAALFAFDGPIIDTTRSITLYCPHEGGHAVIDSVVKLVADRHQADVLVLDALELALGEFGALGKGARAIDAVYEAAVEAERPETVSAAPADAGDKKPEEPKKLEDSNNFNAIPIRRFFEALLDMSLCSSTTNEHPARRIIYLRDFGSIANASKPLMVHILQALATSRQIQHDDGNSQKKKPRAVFLIMGVAATLIVPDDSNFVCGYDWYPHKADPAKSKHNKRLKALRTGDYSIPHIDNKFPILKHTGNTSPCSCSSCEGLFTQSIASSGTQFCKGLSALLFLPLAVGRSCLESQSLSVSDTLAKKVDAFASHSVIFGVFPVDSHSKASRRQQEADKLERIGDINDALLRLTLGRRGVLLKNASSAIIEEKNNSKLREMFLSSVLSPGAADVIVTTVVGHSYSEQGYTQDPVTISPGQIAQAYHLFLKNTQERESWVDKYTVTAENEGESKDPIVQRVAKSPDLDSREKQYLKCIVDPSSLSATTFKDVCIDPTVIESLRRIIHLRILYPHYFKHGILARETINGVLLYGPPGTGKTLLCRAIAHECKARMITLKPSDVLDMWVGENEKNVRSIFSLAYRLAPCIIFIDEMDALFSTRQTQERLWRTDLLTEFMQAIDGLQFTKKNQDKGIIVVGATNRPHAIDPAIIRRLPYRIMIDLPGEKERKDILKIHLRDESLHDNVNLDEFASNNCTEGYSGSDLKNVCVSAAMASVTEAIGESDWYNSKVGDSVDKIDETDTEKTHDGRTPGPGSLYTITMDHFNHALREIGPSFSEEAHLELYQWHDKFSMPESDDFGHHSTKTMAEAMKSIYNVKLKDIGGVADIDKVVSQVSSYLDRNGDDV